MWGSEALVSLYNEMKQPRLSVRFWITVLIPWSKTLLRGVVVWFRCTGWLMLHNPTYEVVKMKVKMLTCNGEGLQTCMSNVERVFARQSLKSWHFTDFSKRNLLQKRRKFDIFNIWRAISRATSRARSWKCSAPQDLIESFILITPYVGFRRIGQPLQRNQTTPPLSVRFWTALF